jgi:hypothetical protein
LPDYQFIFAELARGGGEQNLKLVFATHGHFSTDSSTDKTDFRTAD